ncbi:sensor histidine kinase [Frankia gtarii]|uniref:sensor histidine kinase n=1 Tax=Frankia gtarii TaxID=2950102 RepID=UPI0021C13703|nr:histidine kinase [Frankia gtarii]
MLGRLRHGRVGRFLRAHPKLVDGGLAATLGLLSWAALLNTLAVTAGARQLAVIALTVLGLLPLIWRRQLPAAVFAACVGAGVLQIVVGPTVESNLGVPVAFYTVAALCTRRVRLAAVVVMAASIVLASVAWHHEDQASILADLVVLGLITVTAGVLGRNAGTRRAYLATLTDRADRLERERDQQAQLAAAAERARIAREMHDVVAHNLSVMIALADGAQFALTSSAPQAEQAIAQVSRTGREALAEMRRLLGVLREDGAADLTAPQPRLTDLDALIDQVRRAGLPVSLTISGKSLDLPAGVQLTVFRLVQEALTNTLKHAGPEATATVELRYDRRGIAVDVRDTGRGGAGATASLGGQGLAGMRERSAVYGGTVQAGPGPDGGWRVSARINADGKVPG